MGKRKNAGWSSDEDSSSSSSLGACGACSGRARLLSPPSPSPLPPPIDPIPIVDDRKFMKMVSQFVHQSKKVFVEPSPPPKEEVSILERKIQQAVLLGKATTGPSTKKMRPTKEERQCGSGKKRKATKSMDNTKKKEERSHREIVESMRQSSLRMADKFRMEEKKAEFGRRKRRLRKNLSLLDGPRTTFPLPAWVPPRSPHRLIQERLFNDPWKVVIACIFLHRTTGTQELIDAPEQAVESLIKPLGLYRRRLQLIKRFSYEYLFTNWTDIAQLHGVGTYAEDAYMIFVEGRWKEVIPDDAVLEQYWNWLHACMRRGS